MKMKGFILVPVCVVATTLRTLLQREPTPPNLNETDSSIVSSTVNSKYELEAANSLVETKRLHEFNSLQESEIHQENESQKTVPSKTAGSKNETSDVVLPTRKLEDQVMTKQSERKQHEYQESIQCKETECGGNVEPRKNALGGPTGAGGEAVEEQETASLMADPAIKEQYKINTWIALQAQENLRDAGAFSDKAQDADIAVSIAEAIHNVLATENLEQGDLKVVGLDSDGDVLLYVNKRFEVFHTDNPLDVMTNEMRRKEIIHRLKTGIYTGGVIMFTFVSIIVVWVIFRTDNDELEGWNGALEAKWKQIREGQKVNSFFVDNLRPDTNPLVFTYHQLVLEAKGFDSTGMFTDSAGAFTELIGRYNTTNQRDHAKTMLDELLDEDVASDFIPLKSVSFTKKSLLEKTAAQLSPSRVKRSLDKTTRKLNQTIREKKLEVETKIKSVKREIA